MFMCKGGQIHSSIHVWRWTRSRPSPPIATAVQWRTLVCQHRQKENGRQEDGWREKTGSTGTRLPHGVLTVGLCWHKHFSWLGGESLTTFGKPQPENGGPSKCLFSVYLQTTPNCVLPFYNNTSIHFVRGWKSINALPFHFLFKISS